MAIKVKAVERKLKFTKNEQTPGSDTGSNTSGTGSNTGSNTGNNTQGGDNTGGGSTGGDDYHDPDGGTNSDE